MWSWSSLCDNSFDWSRLRIKGNSSFCSFELSHKQLTQLGTLLRTALAYKGFNWPFFFDLVNLACEKALHFEWKEEGAARSVELRGVPLARELSRYPPRGECAHRLWRNISSMRRSVSSPDETLTRVENTTSNGVFLTNFEVFHLVMKHCRMLDINSQTKWF